MQSYGREKTLKMDQTSSKIKFLVLSKHKFMHSDLSPASMVWRSHFTTAQRWFIGLRYDVCVGRLSTMKSSSCSRNHFEMTWALTHGFNILLKQPSDDGIDDDWWWHCSHKGTDLAVVFKGVTTMMPKHHQQPERHTHAHTHYLKTLNSTSILSDLFHRATWKHILQNTIEAKNPHSPPTVLHL